MINFDDGEKVDTSGELKILRLRDGFLYVVGKGMCIPVNSLKEGKEVIEELS
jgi:hypothetical protein